VRSVTHSTASRWSLFVKCRIVRDSVTPSRNRTGRLSVDGAISVFKSRANLHGFTCLQIDVTGGRRSKAVSSSSSVSRQTVPPVGLRMRPATAGPFSVGDLSGTLMPHTSSMGSQPTMLTIAGSRWETAAYYISRTFTTRPARTALVAMSILLITRNFSGNRRISPKRSMPTHTMLHRICALLASRSQACLGPVQDRAR